MERRKTTRARALRGPDVAGERKAGRGSGKGAGNISRTAHRGRRPSDVARGMDPGKGCRDPDISDTLKKGRGVSGDIGGPKRGGRYPAISAALKRGGHRSRKPGTDPGQKGAGILTYLTP